MCTRVPASFVSKGMQRLFVEAAAVASNLRNAKLCQELLLISWFDLNS